MERPIFISDASAEAERLTTALRAYGYPVIDVPLALLAGRATREQPSVVVCDVDADGIENTVHDLGSREAGSSIVLVFIGAPGGRIDSEFAQRAGAKFVRPVDAPQLIDYIERLVGPPPDRAIPRASPASARPPPLLSRPAPGTGSEAEIAQRDAPASTPPFPPEVDFADAPRPAVPHAELSEEIVALLREAERRVEELEPMAGAAREAPSLEEQIDAELPADVLAALEEPIDEEEEPASGAEGLAPSDSPREGTNLTTSAGGVSRETSAFGETSAKRPAPAEGGTFVTESSARGRTGSRGLTSLDEHPAEAAPAESEVDVDVAEPEDRRARREAATPKPPRAPTRPPPTAQTSPSSFDETRIPAPSPAPSAITVAPKSRMLREQLEDAEEPPTRHAGPSTEPSTAPPPRGSPRDESVAAPSEHQETPPASPGPEPAAAQPDEPMVPKTLREGDAVRALATVIRSRFSGALVLEVDQGIRRVVFREGDFVTAASGVHGESLVAFLVNRGDLQPDVMREAHKLPMFGRHAGAALIAQGYLAQDQLWAVLRAHAEWIVSLTVLIDRGSAALEWELPGRLREEPAVFGGATGAEVLVDIVRRVIAQEVAALRLGGWSAELALGPAQSLLGECALVTAENELVLQSAGSTVHALTARAEDPSFTTALYALAELGVISASQPEEAQPRSSEPQVRAHDDLDEAALRARVAARKALVEEGDYFAVLGVSRRATGYDIRRAYLALRREFDPTYVITAATADLRDDVEEILEVLQEAYEILKDQNRRERYRRAIEATPS